MDKIYAAIDLKSFYASVECVERGLDPLITNLVVADKSRTEKTICLAEMCIRDSYRSLSVADQPGVGIGLFLAREIIQAQKGYIKVTSKRGKGSTFSVFLPIAKKE